MIKHSKPVDFINTQAPLLTWINFNPTIGCTYNKVWWWITYPLPNVSDTTFKVLEWMNNFMSHSIMDVIVHIRTQVNPC